jgi:hypothetical protein
MLSKQSSDGTLKYTKEHSYGYTVFLEFFGLKVFIYLKKDQECEPTDTWRIA